MNTPTYSNPNLKRLFRHSPIQRGLLFGLLIVAALLAFELFNYSTTDFALADLIGDLKFAGVRWATILAIAFCGIDFAGIARLFTPERGAQEPREVWYLFAAWILAATMNALLTWWGVSIAVLNHQTLGNAVIERQTLLRIVPIFVAVMVWLIRVLIIGTISAAGDRLFSMAEAHPRLPAMYARPSVNQPAIAQPYRAMPPTANAAARSFRPAPKATPIAEPNYGRPEPTYHPVGMSEHGNGNPLPRQ